MDNINPSHYKDRCSMECIDVMVGILGPDAVTHGCLMNVIKYLWRYKNKNGEEDLKKAFWYLNKAKDMRDTTPFGVDDMISRVDYMYCEVARKENVDAD